MKLNISKEYSEFNHNNEQRLLDEAHVTKIAKSIKDHGFLPSKPIQVYKKENKFVIVDGHHRFEAAKRIKVAFYYVLESQTCQGVMAVENLLVKKWNMIDYVRLFAARGDENYARLLYYHKKGISISMSSSMMIGNLAASGNASKAVMSGKFKIKETAQIETIVSFIDEFRGLNEACVSRSFVAALSKCLMWEGFDVSHFRNRLRNYYPMIQKQSTDEKMLDEIESVYNYKSKSKIPIKIPAQEAAKKRNVIKSNQS